MVGHFFANITRNCLTVRYAVVVYTVSTGYTKAGAKNAVVVRFVSIITSGMCVNCAGRLVQEGPLFASMEFHVRFA